MKPAHQRHAYNAAQLQDIAKRLKKMLADGTLFALVVFDNDLIGDGMAIHKATGKPVQAGYSSYVSNAERGTIIAALRECAANLEAGMDTPGPVPASAATRQ